jgi:uncharacterized protein YbjT (DUF2867 family)
MSTHPILVIGGTGITGRRVAARLADRGLPVATASRSGDRRFDWTDDTTWDAALDGVRRAYVVSLDGTVGLTAALVERAEARGLERVVLLSARGIDIPGHYGDDSMAAAGHLDAERAVRASGLEWTILRPGWFIQNFTEGIFRDELTETGELRIPAGDGATPYIDAGDIADVAVAALTGDGHAGRTYELSGPRPLTVAEALAEVSAATGRPARYTPVSPEEYIDGLVAAGVDPVTAKIYDEGLHPVRTGGEARVSDGVERALGRPPRDFAAAVRADLEAARG